MRQRETAWTIARTTGRRMRSGNVSVTLAFSENEGSQTMRRDPLAQHLEAAVTMLLAGELAAARSLIREAITGSVGYVVLSERTGLPEKSLVRMFGPNGNPRAENLATVLRELQRIGRVRVAVRVVRRVRYSPERGRRRRARN